MQREVGAMQSDDGVYLASRERISFCMPLPMVKELMMRGMVRMQRGSVRSRERIMLERACKTTKK